MGDAADLSGQMKLDAAKTAAQSFLNTLNVGANPDIRVGLIVFSDDTYQKSSLSTDKNMLINKIGGLYPIAGTAVGDGIQAAVDALNQERGAGATCAIVVMTDGNSNSDHVVSMDPAQAPLIAADHANQSSIAVYSVAFGTDADITMCQQIASRGGGQYFYAANGNQLVSSFVGIASSFVSPALHYGSRILMLIAIPLILFLPEIEKGTSTIIRTFNTTVLKKPVPPPGIRCPQCEHMNRFDAKFCGSCRAPLTPSGASAAGNLPGVRCPRCGHVSRAGAKFCGNRRAKLEAD